jgi:hypothetical protein
MGRDARKLDNRVRLNITYFAPRTYTISPKVLPVSPNQINFVTPVSGIDLLVIGASGERGPEHRCLVAV